MAVARVLELAERPAGLDRTELIDIADEHDAGAGLAGTGEQRLGIAGARHAGLVDHPHLAVLHDIVTFAVYGVRKV